MHYMWYIGCTRTQRRFSVIGGGTMFGRAEFTVAVRQGDCITHDGKLEHGDALLSWPRRRVHFSSPRVASLVNLQALPRSRAVSALFWSGL